MIMRNQESASRRHRLLIIEPQLVVREGLVHLLRAEADLEVVAAVGTPAEAREAAVTTRPDAVLLELVFRDGGGLDLLKQLRASLPVAPILVLSGQDGPLYIERAIRAGASGFVSKHDEAATLLHALRKVLGGGVHVDESTAARVLQAGSSAGHRLTERELQVLELIGRGLRSRDIADTLRLSEKTIEGYRAQIRAKLGLPDAASLLQHAIQWVKIS
jgi:DNA-binding NarL/FixJ family response regulator